MTPTPLRSALYEGTVFHRRHEPAHEFRYPLFLTYLDLDEVDEVLGHHPLWSRRRWSPVRFDRRDFLGDPAVPLAEAVRDRVEAATGRRPRGPISMLAHLRTWGWLHNPITLYYCFERSGSGSGERRDGGPDEHVVAIVAEVTNTPWGERHAYVVPVAPDGSTEHWFPKELHVSPFFGMDQSYRFLATAPGDHLTVRLENHEAGRQVFLAAMSLRRRPITRRTLGDVLWRFPLMTLKVSIGIYAQAARLWWKRTPVHRHPRIAPVSASGRPANRDVDAGAGVTDPGDAVLPGQLASPAHDEQVVRARAEVA